MDNFENEYCGPFRKCFVIYTKFHAWVHMYSSGDVGGFLGLLLGGTVVTLFELLDFVIYNCIVKYQERRRADTYLQRNNIELEK